MKPIWMGENASASKMVLTEDGRRYHAPTRMWMLVEDPDLIGYVDDPMQNLLNPYGEYLLKFARNHGLNIREACEQPMVKARLHFFNETGM